MSHFKVLRTTVFIAVTSTVLFGAAYADDAQYDRQLSKIISICIICSPNPLPTLARIFL